ncbi:nitrogenase cofactor biosynthesis protein NifB [Acidithiobacillus sp. GGI-221]|nr:nitrogenase cofactor biosynthesis protein NifB [Acidithiobacillus sp. GGI-221]
MARAVMAKRKPWKPPSSARSTIVRQFCGQDRWLSEASLEAAGIDAVDRYAFEYIEQSVIAYYRDYLDNIRSGAIVHGQRGDAEIRQGAYIAA